MYSTMPRAFFGARVISVMRALRGSFGSSSPKARPASVSYGPAGPKDAPSKAGDTFFSITIFFTRASTDDGSASVAEISTAVSEAARRMVLDIHLSCKAVGNPTKFAKNEGREKYL